MGPPAQMLSAGEPLARLGESDPGSELNIANIELQRPM